jgi:hypothetical protein
LKACSVPVWCRVQQHGLQQHGKQRDRVVVQMCWSVVGRGYVRGAGYCSARLQDVCKPLLMSIICPIHCYGAVNAVVDDIIAIPPTSPARSIAAGALDNLHACCLYPKHSLSAYHRRLPSCCAAFTPRASCGKVEPTHATPWHERQSSNHGSGTDTCCL